MRTIIVDDEPLALEVLKSFVERLPDLELIQCCNNAIELMQYLRNNSCDLLLLDINMPELSGIDFLKSVNLSPRPVVIFTTAYPNYAIEGYSLDVTDYLLKPIAFDRFLQAVEKAKKIHNQKKSAEHSSAVSEGGGDDFIFVKADKKLIKINLEDILFLEGMKDYVKINTTNGMVAGLMTMKHINEVLPDEHFMRIHKSYIISIDKISSVVGNSVEINKQLIPIGKSYKEEFMKRLNGLNAVN